MKRALIILGVVVVAWYTAVLTVFPDLSGRGGPRLILLAQANLHAHVFSVCSGADEFGDVANSVLLQDFARRKINGNQYSVKVLRDDAGEPAAVITYPKRYQAYKHGLARRVLTLYVERSSFPTFLLTHDGDLYVNRQSQFSARNVPPDDVLDDVTRSEDWRHDRTLPVQAPCSMAGALPSKP